MTPFYFTDLDARVCRQRLLDAGRPGHLAIASDGSEELGAWAPSSQGAPPSGVFCRIVLKRIGDATRIEIRTRVSSLSRMAFATWLVIATGVALYGFVLPALVKDRISAAAFLFSGSIAFSAAVMIMARLLDGRSLKRRVVDAIQRELNARAFAAEPRVAADRAAPGR